MCSCGKISRGLLEGVGRNQTTNRSHYGVQAAGQVSVLQLRDNGLEVVFMLTTCCSRVMRYKSSTTPSRSINALRYISRQLIFE